MAETKTVRARLDQPSERALALLTSHGETESQAVRSALVAAAEQLRRRTALREEVAQLADDPVDRAERLAVLADMDSLGPDVVE